jgi:hypothetical protein
MLKMANLIKKLRKLDKAVIDHAMSTAKKTKKKAGKINNAVLDHAASTAKKARAATKSQFEKISQAKQHKTDF